MKAVSEHTAGSFLYMYIYRHTYMSIIYFYIYATGMEKGLDAQVGISVGNFPYQHSSFKASQPWRD